MQRSPGHEENRHNKSVLLFRSPDNIWNKYLPLERGRECKTGSQVGRNAKMYFDGKLG